MKHARLLAAFCALALLVPGRAFADNNVIDHGTYLANGATGAKVDANGSALTSESAPAMDANLTFANVIQNSSLAVGAADSSAVLDTHRMRLGVLLFKIVPSTGTGVITRLAVEVRLHLNGASDSSSTFPIYLDAFNAGLARASGAADTAGAGHFITGSATALYSGEFSVGANSGRNAPGNAVAAVAWTYPNGIAIPLSNLYGREVWAPYISVRVRNMVGPTCAVTVSLVGTPL